MSHAEPFRQRLPNLADYRRDFVAAGVNWPLPTAPWRAEGLLSALPPPPAGRRGWPWNLQTPPFAASAVGWPKITVVTPSFQQGDYLEETLRSVLLQNYPALELIVLDAGSTDASPALIEKYRPWLSFARIAPDRGQSHALNLGFSLGSGNIFGWLNSDDFYLPGTLQRVATAIRRGADLTYGDSLLLKQENGQLHYGSCSLAAARYVGFPGLFTQPTVFWKADRHVPIWEEQHCSLDYELWIRLLPGLRLHQLGKALAVTREHVAAKTYNPAVKQRWTEDARRNGLAHPELYRANLANRLLAHEYRIAQRLWRAWHARGLAARVESIRRECGWSASPAVA